MGNSSFQINDIILSIAPESINVSRKSFNNEIQTLRTRSSAKTKSGFSTQSIELSVSFVDNTYDQENSNGFDKLKNLISQFRVTPFCYIENEYLRNVCAGGSYDKSMAFVLHQMVISKQEGTTNVINVNFSFFWFNYLPFVKDFTFKRDIFENVEEKNPIKSKAWKFLYKAEQEREFYKSVSGSLQGPTVLHFTEYATVEVDKYNSTKKELNALGDLRSELVGASEFPNPEQNIKRILNRELQNQTWANTLNQEIFGNLTSMVQETTPETIIAKLVDTIDTKVKNEKKFSLIDNSWKVTLDKKGKSIKLPTDLEGSREKDSSKEKDIYILERDRTLNLDDNNLIVNNIVISLENILASIPIIGQDYPTFQHIGSLDARVSFSLKTTDEEGIKNIHNFYSLIENQSLNYRNIPQGFRAVKVENNVINLCGIHYLMTESIQDSTINGQPGASSITIEFSDAPLTPDTQEKLVQVQGFITDNDIRIETAKVLERYLSFSGVLEKQANNTVSIRYPSSSISTDESLLIKNTSILLSPSNEKSFYRIVGLSARQAALEQAVKKYGILLTELIESLEPTIQKGSNKANSMEAHTTAELITNLFSLTDKDIIGIEKFQNDIYSVIKHNDNLSSWFPQSTTSERLKENSKIQKEKQLEIARTMVKDLSTAYQGNPDIIEQATEMAQGVRNQTANIIRTYLFGFQTKVLSLLDEIIYTGFIDLPEFEKVKNLLEEKGKVSSGDCYPDFPLGQVASLIEKEDNSSYQKLAEMHSALGYNTKNLGVSVLLNPDFYFYQPQIDNFDEIIPSYIINKARDSIIDARREMEGVEGDWFLKEYEKKLLGDMKTTTILSDIQKQFTNIKNSAIWASDAGAKYIKDLERTIKNGMVPNELSGSLFNSIFQSEQTGEADDLIQLKPIGTIANNLKNKAYDVFNVFSNYREATSLSSSSGKKIVHHFDTEKVLDSFSESDFKGSSQSSFLTPDFDWPTPTYAQHITSYYGPRVAPIEGASTYHYGIDLAAPGDSTGVDVLAAADGYISHVSYSHMQQNSKGNSLGRQGVTIIINHGNNYITKYFHLLWNKEIQDLSDIFWQKNGGQFIAEPLRDNFLTVYKGTKIASIGNTGLGTGAHLHFEIWNGKEAKNPLEYLDPNSSQSAGPVKGVEIQHESILTKSVDQLKKELIGNQGYSMNRAYPTFKLYFIESDQNERKRFAFDDFFSYSAIKEIQFISSRKIVADLLIFQVTNISGVFSNKKFQNALDPTSAKNSSGETVKENAFSNTVNTKFENPIASLMLQTGTEVRLELGYSNDPNQLEGIFNGTITDIEFSDSSELITITCQSFGVELVQTVQGEVKTFGGWFSGDGRTHKILEELLAYPEVVHFGRWEKNDIGVNTQRGLLTNRWRLFPSPQDDNIFAPMGGTSSDLVNEFIKTTKYKMYNTTIWDVMQEMTLRHPSYIVDTRPYMGKNNDARMTLFFGLPDQLYFARDSSYLEDSTLALLKKTAEEGISDDGTEVAYQRLRSTNPLLAEEFDSFKSSENNQELKKSWFNNFSKQYALDQGFIKPFRGYHVVTSAQHIIMNNISSSHHNCFNTVTVEYGNSPAAIDENTSELIFEEGSETFTLKADEAIPDEEIRELFVQYPNCVGEEMAKRYAVSLLFNTLKEGYKGSLVITGNPSIRKNDIVYIFDEYTDMYGPIEVEQVVHRFSQQTGFITEITPDLCVHVNQHSTLSTQDAMGLIAEAGLKKIGLERAIEAKQKTPYKIITAPLTGISTLFFSSNENVLDQSPSSAFGLIGTFIFRKLITRSQLGHPFRFSPLTLGGKPMIGGLPNRRTDGSFIQGIGKWYKEAKEGMPLLIQDVGDTLSPSTWFGHGTGSISEYILGKK